MKRLFLTSILVITAAAPLGIAPAKADQSPPAPVSDVRVLIDVSGSMKQNDPLNLRAPALRLIVGLLPPDAKAGVWTFGQYVNMLVPYGTVTPAWRDKARTASHQINSNGLYTNIEGALKRATWDWNTPDPHVKRSLIMLTDGIVDVAKDKTKDAASRHRILDAILPRLRKAGVTIHTIALSDSADRLLLKQLAAATGGWYEQADNAGKLEKAFLRVFEKSAHRDTLPLTHNEIHVDSQIQELTLLIFRKKGAALTRLVTPDRETLSQKDASQDLRWHHETGYDLITIEKPKPGPWKVLADVDPDNRVMVVTNLKLAVSRLPNQALVGNTLPLTLRLTQNGRTITKPAFLKFVDATLIQNDTNGKTWRWPVRDDGQAPDKKAHDGIYTIALDKSLTEGQHEIRVLVDGITFQREARQLIDIVTSPVITTLTPGQAGQYSLSVIPREGLIDAASMAVRATVTDPQGKSTSLEIPKVHDSEWRQSLSTGGVPGVQHVSLTIRARTLDGQTVNYRVGPLVYGEAATPASTAHPTPKAAPVKVSGPAPNVAAKAKRPRPAPPPSPPREDNWKSVVTSIFLLNLFVLGGGYYAYRRARDKTHVSLSEIEDELA